MHSSMCGALGIGIDLNRASDEKLQEIRRSTSQTIRRSGIRFSSASSTGFSSLKKRAPAGCSVRSRRPVRPLLFLDHERFGETWHTVKLRGLKENAVYEYELDGKILRKTGAYLMQFGLALHMKGDYDSRLIIFTEKERPGKASGKPVPLAAGSVS